MKNCKQCHTSIDNKKNKFCSRKCYWSWKKGISLINSGSFKVGQVPWNSGTAKIIICKECGIQYKKSGNRGKYFCSMKCRSLNKEWKSKVIGNLLIASEKYTPEIRKKLSDSRLGKTPKWMLDPNKKANFIKRQSIAKKGKPSPNKGKKYPSMSGVNSPNWKGGITPTNRMGRLRFKREMQENILERDNYTCQICRKRGGSLQVDHIKPWAKYPELRFIENNCRTLCMDCHYKVTFGYEKPANILAWGHNLTRIGG